MSNNAPCITICIGSRDQIMEGVSLLNGLLYAEDGRSNAGNPNDADTPHPKNEPAELTPQQKAAATRKANKIAKEQAASAQAEKDATAAINRTVYQAAPTPVTPGPATPAVPTTTSAPVLQPAAAAAPAPVETQGPAVVLDYAALSNEARQINAKLGMEGKQTAVAETLKAFGVQRLDALPQEQWGNFLTHIRTL